MPAPQTNPVVSRNCADGKHGRCLGKVYVTGPDGAPVLSTCECRKRGCTHGEHG